MPRQLNKLQLIRLEEEYISNSSSAFLKLPEEVRGLIFGKCDQETARVLRLVCRQLKMDVEKYFLYRVEFSQDNPVMPWLSSLCIRDCLIVIPTDEYKSNLVRGIRFQHPETLRRFAVIHPLLRNNSSEGQLIPSPCPEVYTELLQSCSKHVKKVSLTLDSQVLAHPFPAGLTFQFPNLTVMKIKVRVPKNRTPPPCTELQTSMGVANRNGLFQLLINQSETRKLQSISIDTHLQLSTANEQLEVLINVLQFLGKSRMTPLTVFKLFVPMRILESNTQCLELSNILSVNEMGNFNRINSLENVQMEYVTINNEGSCWRKLLVNQRKLKSVHLKSVWNIPCHLVQELVCHNSDTLVKIFLSLIKSVTEENGIKKPFDFSMFRKCGVLSSLNLESNVFDTFENGEASIKNLHFLPPQLGELLLFNFKVETAELLRFGHEKCKSLHSLTIEHGGMIGSLGVTGTVINQLMRIENLKYIKCNELNISDPFENVVVTTIINVFGTGRFTATPKNEIRLFRDPDTKKWD